MKKSRLTFTVFFSIVLLSVIVSAQVNLEQGSRQIINWIQDIFGPFLQALFGSSEYIFEKFLFLFIIMAFIYVSLSKSKMFDSYPGVIWILAITISFLSTRYLTQVQYFIGLLIPYTALGVVLTAGIPLLIMFFFIESIDSGIIRKIFWIFYTVVFVGLWISQYARVGWIGWAYFFSAFLSILFLIFDGTIRRSLLRQEIKQLNIDNRREYEREVTRNLDKAREDLNNNIISSSEYNQLKRKLKRKLKAIRKM
jgi:hypothetical protein